MGPVDAGTRTASIRSGRGQPVKSKAVHEGGARKTITQQAEGKRHNVESSRTVRTTSGSRQCSRSAANRSKTHTQTESPPFPPPPHRPLWLLYVDRREKRQPPQSRRAMGVPAIGELQRRKAYRPLLHPTKSNGRGQTTRARSVPSLTAPDADNSWGHLAPERPRRAPVWDCQRRCAVAESLRASPAHANQRRSAVCGAGGTAAVKQHRATATGRAEDSEKRLRRSG